MARATAFVHNSTVAYMPSYDGSTHFFKVTTAANTAQRLGDLLTVPSLIDETYSMSGANSTTGASQPIKRPPFHLFIQVPGAVDIAVYLTWDNVTTPVVGGPGMELQAGVIYEFENAGEVLLKGGYQMTGGYADARYQVDPKTAFQIIANDATDLLVWFSD